MNTQQALLKQSIKNAIALQKDMATLVNSLKKQCICEFEPLTDEQINDEWMSESADCVICGEYYGWRCKVSPDGCCHYFSKNGTIKLATKNLYQLPDTHDQKSENYDECVFCGHPEERK